MKYIPKDEMCATCQNGGLDCSKLVFKEMPRMSLPKDGYVTVKCTRYIRRNK